MRFHLKYGFGRSGRRFRRSTLPAALGLSWALGGCALAAEGLTVEQARLGNVFLTGEAVQIPVRSAGERIDWRIEDFFGAEVARGSLAPVRGHAVIEPDLQGPGYFEVHLEAKRDDATLAADTAFAVIAPPPETSPDETPFGVMTHFAQGWDRDLMPLIARAGIQHIRDEQYWNTVEPAPGEYVFPRAYTAYMAEARAHGIEPLIVMSFANDNYDDGLTPHSDAGRDGYARYGETLLGKYGDDIGTLEIWNEYNGSYVEGPAAHDRAASYTAMLERAYERIKAVRPDVEVLGGATVLVPLPYLEDVFELGGLEHMDAVAVHPYRGEPEGVERDIAALRALMERHAGGAAKPIWVTEFGRHVDGPRGRHRNASYLVRLATLLLSQRVERMYWYLMRDYRDFDSMGLVRADDSPLGRYAPAPAYVAYANLIRMLAGADYVRREPSDPRTHIHVFERDGEEIRVGWSAAGMPQMAYATETPLRVVDIMGDATTLEPVDGTVELTLDANPVFVEGPVRAVRERRGDSMLAASEYDFAHVQGTAGWSYGHYDGDGEGEGDGNGPGGPYSDDDFERLTTAENAWGRYWGHPELGPLKIQRQSAHPSRAGERPVWAVRRWRSAVAGTVHISGTIAASGGGGDGVTARILIDGAEVFAMPVGGPDHEATRDYGLSATVREGSTVDFAVTPGPATDVDYDATTFDALITVPILADSEEDFATRQGTRGWHYGQYDGDGAGEGDGAEPAGPYTDDDFERLTAAADGAPLWRDPGPGPIRVDRRGGHPSVADGRPVWAVRRWLSDSAGHVRITGTIAPSSARGDGTTARILVDGTEVFATEIGGPGGDAAHEYAVSATIEDGSAIDFVITPGSGLDVDYDATTFTALIEAL